MAAAFVVDDSHYNKDSDGEMDEHSDNFAWVFPEGIELGHPAQYHEKRYRASGFPRYGAVDTSRSEVLAVGTVASINGVNVTFAWDRAAGKHDEGAWQLVSAPAATLRREEESESWVGNSNHGYGSRRNKSSRGRHATRCDGRRISAPDAAWALVQRPTFIATLVSSEVQPDEQLALVLTTVGGENIQVTVAQNSTIAAVAAVVRQQRGLNAEVHIVSTNCAKLDPQADVHLSCNVPAPTKLLIAPLD